MIGRIEKTVLDCPDPRALAGFYAELLGMRVNEDTDGAWVVIGREPGMRELAFQRADDYRAPSWPDTRHPQQEHLDIRVDDVDDSAAVAPLQGPAASLRAVGGSGVLLPFCLVYG